MWSVYNDLDVTAHVNSRGTVGRGLGIEVQQTMWASDDEGDIVFPPMTELPVHQFGTTDLSVRVEIVDPGELTGHEYMVSTDSLPGFGQIWRLEDVTTDQTILGAQTTFDGSNQVVTHGFIVKVTGAPSKLASFEVVANGAGVIDPPESGAAPWYDFPVPTEIDPDGYPTDGQQVGEGIWLFHTGGDYQDYDEWIACTFRSDANRLAAFDAYDWEMRFTGSNSNPGVNGCYAWAAFTTGAAIWVPFELWRTGIGTPDDPSDDVRLIPWIYDDGGDSLYYVSSWGADPNCGPRGCEHSVSGGDNDPYTDWIYWKIPGDQTPGDASYQVFETAMLSDPYNWAGDYETAVMDRTVLANWNGDTTATATGGATVPSGYNQDLPELGTVFRLVTEKTAPIDTFTFKADPLEPGVAGPEGVSVYARFKLINKGGMTLNNFFASIWFDPDLGDANDDYVGCDPDDNVFYCYNCDPLDTDYGSSPPAVGVRLIEGPIVPSEGDTAYVDGLPVPDHRNLGLYSFNRYVNPLGPDNWRDSYRFMTGLTKDGSALLDHQGNPTRYFGYGDPVAGTGFLDSDPCDRRMMANIGPFTFRPDDTQQVVIKISVGQGSDHLNSITKLRQILAYVPDVTDVEDGMPPSLPAEFSVEQNYPNPFNPSTMITYSLPSRVEVTVTIFNILGRRVTALHQGWQSAGDHTVVWEGTDDSGNRLASGVYFYRVRADDEVQSRKMMFLK